MASLFTMSEIEDAFAIFHDLRAPAIRTETTSPYTAIIPDMTTGMRDCGRPLASFEHITINDDELS